MQYVKLVLLFSKLFFVDSAKILGIFQVPSMSHQFVYRALVKELSLRGHQVVSVISTKPLVDDSKLSNLTEILMSYPIPTDVEKAKYSGFSYTQFFRYIFDIGLRNAEVFLQDKRIQNLCKNDTFDVVIVEGYFPIWYAFGEKCKAPTIGITTMDGLLSSHNSKGNPIHPALYGDFMLGHIEAPSIWKKIEHLYYVLWYKWFNKYIYMYNSDRIIKKYMGDGYPKTADMEKNASMLFINTNVLMSTLRPLTPSTIPLGFMHIRPVEALPTDLQTILDEAKHGVVYFSLGSNVKSSGLPSNTVGIIKAALSELPFTVLWKWETDDTPDVGRNVVTRKWFPQQDILAHPNVKAFVTQGGLQSTEEAIIYAVPMVGIPFFCDQEMNVRKGEKLGISIYLDKTTLTKENLKRAVLEIVQNKKYQKKIKELQKIAKDQPMTGLERAVWWTEYVIRHKGAKHLRSPAADISLFEYLLLDVILVVLSVLSLTSFVLYKVIRILLRLFSRKMRSKVKQS